MKKLLFRKFYQDISAFFLASLLIVGLIVWTIQAVNYFDYVTEDGHGLKIYFFYSILNFPKIIHRILPFIFFLSVFYTIIKYEVKNEIFIFWINGISKINFINKLIVFSFIIVFFQIILGSYFSPLSKLKARNYIKNSNVDFFTSLIKEGKFINVTKGLTIFIDSKEADGSFKNIFLEETRKRNSKMIYANKGILIDDDSQKTLKLFDGRVINFDNSKINIFNFDQINFSLKDLDSKTITVPKIQEIDTKILLSCFFDIENNKFQLFECDENLTKEAKLELIKRLYKPIFIPLVVLFSCFLTLYSKNEKIYKTKVNLIFVMIFFLLVYSEVSVRYSVMSDNLTILYLLIPIFIFISGYYLFYRLVKNV
mgnify:CR=1 FL=1|jgi:lipopolysaccharide export system permease protein